MAQRRNVTRNIVFTEVFGIEYLEEIGESQNKSYRIMGELSRDKAQKIVRKKHPNFVAEKSETKCERYQMTLDDFMKHAEKIGD